MSCHIKNLKLPLSEESARSLKLGELVTVTGEIFTGRSLFHIRAIEKDITPPLDYQKKNCFFHVGPVMKQEDNNWKIVSIEPTSSIRFERYGADVVKKLKLRTIIGKTTMGMKTAEALKAIGGVYLSKIGICGNQLSAQVKAIKKVYFLEQLGKTEATWVFEVERFGPFFVAIDAEGNNYFQDLNNKVSSNIKNIFHDNNVPEDYNFTEVNA